MRKYIALFMCFALLTLFAGCGDQRTIDGITYDTWGLFNKSEKRNPDIRYKVNIPSIIVATILIETIIVPIYIIGFDLMEPIGAINHNLPIGAVSSSKPLEPVQDLRIVNPTPEGDDSVY